MIMPNHLHGIVMTTNDDVQGDNNAHDDKGGRLAPLQRDKSA